MKIKKKLKGFTLVELIVVMAIFSILMIAVMQVINPLNKLSKRASIQEANAAAVDNIKTYLEGSLRYADCVQVCIGGLTDNSNKLYSEYAADELLSKYGVSETGDAAYREAAVINYIDSHYANRTNPGTDEELGGKVRMLKVDNANGGKVTEYEWNFTAGYTYYDFYDMDGDGHKKGELKGIGRKNSTLAETPNSGEEVINPVYYENYAFYITPGYNEMKTIEEDENNTVSGITAKHEAGDYNAALVPMESTGLKLEKDYSLTADLFTLSVVTFKNDSTTSETGEKNYKYKGKLTTKTTNEDGDPVTTESVAFRSPFALSNTNMSLVNINSEYGKLRDMHSGTKVSPENYGPLRINGTPDVDKYGTKYPAGTFTPTTLIAGDNGKTTYIPLNETLVPKIFTRLDRHLDVAEDKSDDCLYFIYTLPEFK